MVSKMKQTIERAVICIRPQDPDCKDGVYSTSALTLPSEEARGAQGCLAPIRIPTTLADSCARRDTHHCAGSNLPPHPPATRPSPGCARPRSHCPPRSAKTGPNPPRQRASSVGWDSSGDPPLLTPAQSTSGSLAARASVPPRALSTILRAIGSPARPARLPAQRGHQP